MATFHRLMLLACVLTAFAAPLQGQDFIGFNGGNYDLDLPEGKDPTVLRGNLDTLLPTNVWVAGSLADQGLGYNGSYATAGVVTSLWTDRQDAWYFMDVRGHVTENEQFFGNFGLGRRQYIKSMEGVLGISAFFDYDGDAAEVFGHNFQQVGVSFELMWERARFSLNGYIPVGRTDYQEDEDIFQGNQIVVAGVDAAFRGFDTTVEVPVPLPWFRQYDFRWKMGGYAYQSDLVGPFGGIKYGCSGRLHPNCIINLEMNYDDTFQTTGRLQFVWHFGPSPGYTPWGGELEPVDRQEHITRFNRPTFIAVNPATGLAWNVVHVDGDNAGFEDGTAENPWNTLAEADGTLTVNSAANDMIFVHLAANEATNYADGITLLNGQFLLGDGRAHTIPEAQLGTFTIPDFTAGVRPIITNGAGPAVTLADDNRVASFVIDTPIGNAVFGSGINNTNLIDIRTENATANAIHIDGGTGVLNFTRLDLEDTAGHGIFLDNTVASASFTSNIITDATLDAIHIEDGTGGTYDFTTNTLNGTGAGANGVVVLRQTGGLFRFNGGTVNGFTADGLHFEDSTALNTRITGLVFNGIGNDAIHYDTNTGASTFVHTNLTINGAGNNGIFMDGNTGLVSNTGITMNGVTANGIHLQNARGPVNFSGGHGVFLDTVTGNVTFTGGTITNPGLDAVHIEDSTGGTYTFTGGTYTSPAAGVDGIQILRHTGGVFRLSGLTITDFAGHGVHIADSTGIDFRLASSTITGSGLNGVFLDNNTGTGTVTSSTITGNGGLVNAGVRVLLTGATGRTFTANITGSTLNGNGFGIISDAIGLAGVDDGGPLLTTNIRNNLNIDANEGDGILVRGDQGARHNVVIAQNSSIDGNGVTDGAGIRIDTDINNVLGADGTTLMNVTIDSNTLVGNLGRAASDAAGIDALVQLNSNLVAVVTGNTIDGTGAPAGGGTGVAGILFDWQVTNGTVNNLTLNDNSSDHVNEAAVESRDPARLCVREAYHLRFFGKDDREAAGRAAANDHARALDAPETDRARLAGELGRATARRKLIAAAMGAAAKQARAMKLAEAERLADEIRVVTQSVFANRRAADFPFAVVSEAQSAGHAAGP